MVINSINLNGSKCIHSVPRPMRHITEIPIETGLINMAILRIIEPLCKITINISKIVSKHSCHGFIRGLEIMWIIHNAIKMNG